MYETQLVHGREDALPTTARRINAALIGAVLGAIVAYLCLTDRGRRWRSQIDYALDEAARHLVRARRGLNAGLAALHETGVDDSPIASALHADGTVSAGVPAR